MLCSELRQQGLDDRIGKVRALGILKFLIILILLLVELKTLSYFKFSIISILKINQTLRMTLSFMESLLIL